MATVPVYRMVDTWNNGSTLFNSIKIDITDTASDVSSRMVALSTSLGCSFTVDKLGCVNCLTLGYGAGSVNTNLAIGYRALSSNTTGYENTAIGYGALSDNVSGFRNTVIGNHTGFNSYHGRFPRCTVMIGHDNHGNINPYQATTIGHCQSNSDYGVGIGHQGVYGIYGIGRFNVLIGNSIGRDSPDYVTIIGYRAGCEIAPSGFNDEFLGACTGWFSGITRNSVFAGYKAGVCTNSGRYEISIGACTGDQEWVRSSETSNISVGFGTLSAHPSGDNIAIGSKAINTATDGQYNLAIGAYALSRCMYNAAGNIVIGYKAGVVQTGNDEFNSGGDSITVGNYIGGYNNTEAVAPIAIGFCSLYCSRPSTDNQIAIGNYTLYNSISGNNLAIGYRSLSSNTTGIDNLAIGADSLLKNITGSYNTSVGWNSGYDITTGNCNTGLGYCSSLSITTANNTIAVGWCASPDDTNHHTVWGNSGNNVCNCVYASWSNVSDKRDKTDIITLDNNYGIKFIQRLNPVKYRWDHRETYQRECGCKYGEKDGTLKSEKSHYGFIAQDVKKAIEDLGIDFDGLGYDKNKDAYRLTYEELLAPIVKTLKELIDDNNNYNKQLKELKDRYRAHLFG